ncbi:MAG: ABC transporter permease subunit [Clostridia bacterium]|nr:ABC transporter permease subunit [Clostridia bacterium]
MIKLIKNEIIKILKNKTIYILLALLSIIIVANTIIGTSIYGGIIIDHTEEARQQEKINLTNKINELDINKDIDDYIKTKSKLELINLMSEYPIGSWQEQVIVKNEAKIENLIKEINIYTYQIKDKGKQAELQKNYNEFLKPLKDDNWEKFVTNEIIELEKEIEKLEKNMQNEKNVEQKQFIQNQINQHEFDIEFLKIRLTQKINHEKGEQNTLLKEYKNQRIILESYTKKIEEYNYSERLQYNKIKANVKELEYKIYNNIPILELDNARDMLNNSLEYYELLIILTIVIIGTASISDEFNRGTIKLLLVKPYKRWKILLSKIIAIIILIIILNILIIFVQFIIGGLVYSFEDYVVPIIQYNFNTNEVQTTNVLINVTKIFIAKFPMYLILLCFSLFISCASSNSSLSIFLGMLIYLSKNIISLKDNTEFFKYLISVNWDFVKYLYGKLPEVEYLSLEFSLTMCFVWGTIILLITFINFNNKDIKNI